MSENTNNEGRMNELEKLAELLRPEVEERLNREKLVKRVQMQEKWFWSFFAQSVVTDWSRNSLLAIITVVREDGGEESYLVKPDSTERR